MLQACRNVRAKQSHDNRHTGIFCVGRLLHEEQIRGEQMWYASEKKREKLLIEYFVSTSASVSKAALFAALFPLASVCPDDRQESVKRQPPAEQSTCN